MNRLFQVFVIGVDNSVVADSIRLPIIGRDIDFFHAFALCSSKSGCYYVFGMNVGNEDKFCI